MNLVKLGESGVNRVAGGAWLGGDDAVMAALMDAPFPRLAALLADVAPAAGLEPVNLAVGEPKFTTPAMILPYLGGDLAGWGRYPPPRGEATLRMACADWLTRRHHLPAGFVDADRHVTPVSGAREALAMIAQIVVAAAGAATGARRDRPAILIPDPAYHVYFGAALLAGAEPVPVPCRPEAGFVADIAALPEDLLARTALAFLCTPSNPHGAVMSRAQLAGAIGAARRFGFALISDEVYSELYWDDPPSGALAACAHEASCGASMDGVAVVQSLSKRSSAAGLRSGFVAGDPALVRAIVTARSYAGCPPPLPVQAAAAALWRDEAHVAGYRRLYAKNITAADRVFAGHAGYTSPPAGMFVWLDVGDGEAFAARAWAERAARVFPGGYMTRSADADGRVGARYVRIALVQQPESMEESLGRIASLL